MDPRIQEWLNTLPRKHLKHFSLTSFESEHLLQMDQSKIQDINFFQKLVNEYQGPPIQMRLKLVSDNGTTFYMPWVKISPEKPR
jgi:hypothetical protein